MQYFGKKNELGHIYAALAALQARDKGLILSKSLRKFSLRHTSSLPLLDEESNERFMTFSSKSLLQSAPTLMAGA